MIRGLKRDLSKTLKWDKIKDIKNVLMLPITEFLLFEGKFDFSKRVGFIEQDKVSINLDFLEGFLERSSKAKGFLK